MWALKANIFTSPLTVTVTLYYFLLSDSDNGNVMRYVGESVHDSDRFIYYLLSIVKLEINSLDIY